MSNFYHADTYYFDQDFCLEDMHISHYMSKHKLASVKMFITRAKDIKSIFDELSNIKNFLIFVKKVYNDIYIDFMDIDNKDYRFYFIAFSYKNLHIINEPLKSIIQNSLMLI